MEQSLKSHLASATLGGLGGVLITVGFFAATAFDSNRGAVDPDMDVSSSVSAAEPVTASNQDLARYVSSQLSSKPSAFLALAEGSGTTTDGQTGSEQELAGDNAKTAISERSRKLLELGQRIREKHASVSGSSADDRKSAAQKKTLMLNRIGYAPNGQALSEAETRKQIQLWLKHLPEFMTINYPASGESKRTIVVFDDPTCLYCRALHKAIPELQSAGVTVRVVPTSRHAAAGLVNLRIKALMENMANAWCSPDPAGAFDRVMRGEKVPAASCDELPDGAVPRKRSNIRDHIIFAKYFGVGEKWGTPLIVTDSGELIEGFSRRNGAQRLLLALGLAQSDTHPAPPRQH